MSRCSIPAQISTLNCLPVTVQDIHDDPHLGHVLVRLELAGRALLSRITRRSRDQLGLVPGDAVYALVKGVVVS